MTSPVFSTISRGSRGLPVAWAGHTEVHRPQIVQASVSKSCFQVKSSTVDAPNVSSSVSMRFGISRIAPLGRGRSFRYMFIGLVIMWRSIVVGRITRKPRNATTWMLQDQRCSVPQASERPAVDDVRERPADEGPLLEVRGRARSSLRSAAMRKASVVNPVTAMTRNVTRITRCSGFVLMRIRYGRWPYRRANAHRIPTRKMSPNRSPVKAYAS